MGGTREADNYIHFFLGRVEKLHGMSCKVFSRKRIKEDEQRIHGTSNVINCLREIRERESQIENEIQPLKDRYSL